MSRHFTPFPVIGVLLTVVSGAFAADLSFKKETHGQLRLSKLTGMSILGPEHQVDGTITDMLIGDNGQVAYVIIGVGGFLGIGRKDIAIPFAQLKFTDTPILPPQNPAGFDNTSGSPGSSINGDIRMSGAMTLNSGVAMATSGVVSNNITTDRACNVAKTGNTVYPDHGVIDLDLDQLKRATPYNFSQ